MNDNINQVNFISNDRLCPWRGARSNVSYDVVNATDRGVHMTDAEFIQGGEVEQRVLCPEATCFRKGVKFHVFRTGYGKNQHYDAHVTGYSKEVSQAVVESCERSYVKGYGVGINVGDGLGSSGNSGAECGLVYNTNVEDRMDLMYQQEQVSYMDRVDQQSIRQNCVLDQVTAPVSDESSHSGPRAPISGCLPDSDDNNNQLFKCVDSDFISVDYNIVGSINNMVIISQSAQSSILCGNTQVNASEMDCMDNDTKCCKSVCLNSGSCNNCDVSLIEWSFPRCVYAPRPVQERVSFVQETSDPHDIQISDHTNSPPAYQTDEEYLEAAVRITHSGKHNCDGLRIPIWSDLNLNTWASLLSEYQDARLLQFLTYGFPLGTKVETLNRTHVTNHFSAVAFPDQVEKFLRKERKLGAILGPFTSWPVAGCHVSPLMTRPKCGDERRIILDLSYGGSESVNGNARRGVYDRYPFALTLPSLDHLIHDILNCPGRPKLIKIDISRAFRIIRVDPGDAIKLGMQFGGKYYLDRSLAFGAVNCTAIFQRVTDAIRKILACRGVRVWNYIDDIFACVEEDSADAAFTELKGLIINLGLPINPDKVVTPSDVMVCMGIEVDASNKPVRIPQDKLSQILEECQKFHGWLRVSRQALQSLLGRLLYVAKVVVPARAFLNRMLSYLRLQQGPIIRLGEAFVRDLNWFTSLIHAYNQSPSFDMIEQASEQHVFVDASLLGLGGYWGKMAYFDRIPDSIKRGRGIVHFEMFNVYVAIRHWGKKLQGCRVCVNSDNMAVVQIVNSYRTNDPFLGMCIRNILWVAARYNLHIGTVHVLGVDNKIADALSRLLEDEKRHKWVIEGAGLQIQNLSKEELSLDGGI